MGQLTTAVPPQAGGRGGGPNLPNSKLVFMTFIWQNVMCVYVWEGVELGTHLTPRRVLNVTPTPRPCLLAAPGFGREQEVQYITESRGGGGLGGGGGRPRPRPGGRKLCLPTWEPCNWGDAVIPSANVNCPEWCSRSRTPQRMQTSRPTHSKLDLCLDWSLPGVYNSLYLCLCTHSPRLSYIPKEAITSRASASPWAVVIVTRGSVDMTTPPWSRDKW